MTNFFKQIKQAGDEYSLSQNERTNMRRVVREYMAMKPVRSESYSMTVSYRWFSFAHRPIAAALCLVLIFGTGVSYAAENALPGDTLYAVKTYVNEPARLALATTPEAKANVQIDLAERRIDEATALAAEGRLDSGTQTQLASAFESYAAAASDNIEETDTEDSPAAVELASRFETRLAAHDEVIAEVENEDNHDISLAIRDAGRTVADIRARVEESAEVSENITIAPVATLSLAIATSASDNTEGAAATEPTSTASTTSNVSRFATLRMQSAAQKQLKAMRKNADNSDDTKAQLEVAAQRIDEGNDQLESGETALAFHSFQDSLVITEKLDVLLKAAPNLAKVQSRKKSDRAEVHSEAKAKAALSTSELSAPPATTTPEATQESTTTAIESTTSAQSEMEIHNFLPPTLRIFPFEDHGHEDSDTSHKDSGALEDNVQL